MEMVTLIATLATIISGLAVAIPTSKSFLLKIVNIITKGKITGLVTIQLDSDFNLQD